VRPGGPGRRSIAHAAFEAADCDPLLALDLVCDLIKAGVVRASDHGLVVVESAGAIAA
jgi:hypothetical protein